MSAKKKLPKKVWIVADSLGWYACEESPKPTLNTTIAVYVPAEPKKVCVWTEENSGPEWSLDTCNRTSCKHMTGEHRGDYCP